MLHEFLAANRDAIIARSEATVKLPTLPSPSTSELANGATMFLTQVSETLRLEATATPFSSTAIGSTAARHGGDVLCGNAAALVLHFDHHKGIRSERSATGAVRIGRVWASVCPLLGKWSEPTAAISTSATCLVQGASSSPKFSWRPVPQPARRRADDHSRLSRTR